MNISITKYFLSIYIYRSFFYGLQSSNNFRFKTLFFFFYTNIIKMLKKFYITNLSNFTITQDSKKDLFLKL